MDDRTESFEHYEPESYEWDYEEARDRPPRVLWGRLIALVVLLIAAFWLGRSTAPSDARAEDLAAATQRAEQAESKTDDLEARLAELNAEEPEPTPEPSASTTPEVTGEGRTYIVKSGDSLAAIAF